MKKLHKITAVKSLILLGLIAGLAVMAADTALADGKSLYTTKGCVACHGADGKAPLLPTYAKLAGQQAPYIVVQLKAFKAQERKSGQSALMWGMAAQLSETEMKQIADYLSKVK